MSPPVVTARISPKKEEILDAATKAFRNEGFDLTSMDRIAELAGASKRTVYNHFESKEILFQAVVDRLMGKLHELKQVPWDPERSLEEQLSEFAAVKSVVATDPTWSSLIHVLLGIFVRDPDMARSVMIRAAEGEQALVRWLSAADEAGRLSVPDPERAAQLFWAMAGGALFWPQVFLAPMDEQTRVEVTREIVETFLCRFRSPCDESSSSQ